jgi:hypothetical protein
MVPVVPAFLTRVICLLDYSTWVHFQVQKPLVLELFREQSAVSRDAVDLENAVAHHDRIVAVRLIPILHEPACQTLYDQKLSIRRGKVNPHSGQLVISAASVQEQLNGILAIVLALRRSHLSRTVQRVAQR